MKRGTYASSNGKDTIVFYVFEPEGQGGTAGEKPRAILQICHGMCEYLERYSSFAQFLNSHGILVCGNDHLGHGASAKGPEDFGYFAEKDGWKCLVEDVHTLEQQMRKEYPETPYFLMGHSMGSFVARAYLSQYGEGLSGALLLGTSGGNPLIPKAYPILEAMKKLRGPRWRSRLITNLAFGAYNRGLKPHRTEHDWISSDEEVVDRYNSDPRCTFLFTLSGFLDLFRLLEHISLREWAERVSVDLPILLLSGEMDPVGDRGKGVKAVHDRLAFAGVKDLIMRLYPGCRHELLNERNRRQVQEDILAWIEKRIS